MLEHGMSERRACELCGMSRSQFKYQSCKTEDPEIIKEILRIKEKYSYYGLPRVLALLRRKGFIVNGKRVYRILKVMNLQVCKKRKKIKLFITKVKGAPDASRVGDTWAMDFVFDRLKNNDPFRCLTIIDHYSREIPGILVSRSMAGFSPVEYLEHLKETVNLPKHIVVDNGPEFANTVFVDWCKQHEIALHFIDPGKPVQNAYVESFNGKFRKEFLDQNKFNSIREVQKRLEQWIKYYNEERPHSSLDYLTPKEFADQEKAVLNKKNNLLVLKTG